MMTNNRSLFWIIWGVALTPVLLAVLAWVSGIGVPAQGSNRGELVQPVQTLEEWGGQAERHTGHWSLLLVHENACQGECADQIGRAHV